MVERALDTEYINLSIVDGVVYGLYKEGIRINLDVAKQVVKERLAFCEGQLYPTLGTLKGNIVLERDAREYFGTKEAVQGMTKMALLIDSRLSKVLVNWYLSLSKPLVPTRVFTEEGEAVQWLKE